jgi:hypothetical protein
MAVRVVALLLLALLGPLGAHAATPSVTGYFDCARAMGVAINDKLAVIPGELAGDRGLYIYTERRAYFLPLGAPHARQDEADEFFVRTSIATVGDVFLVFRDRTPGSSSKIQPGVGYNSVAPGGQATYRFTAARLSDGEQAIDPLRVKLKERIVAVTRFLNDKHRYSPPSEAKNGFDADRTLYLARLDRCRFDGDLALTLAVDEEVKKLSPGFTGVTIWEKQVGRRGLEQHR